LRKRMVAQLAKCKYYDPIELGHKVNCAKCRKWTGTRCRDHEKILREYEESKAFGAFDRMMRSNKGIRLD